MAWFFTGKLESLARWMEQTGWQKLEKLALVLGTCLLLLWGVRLVSRAVRRAVDDGDDDVTTEAERRAETLGSVLNHTAWVLVVAFFLLMTLQEFGVNVGPLVAGAGIAGVALGFGAQSLVKDVIAGFFLLLENQFAVGDIISVDETHVGTVERMTLRITQIRDSEGRAHFIPNGSITRVVVLSKDFARTLVSVDLGASADLDRAMELLREIGRELAADLHGAVLEPTDVKGVEALIPGGFTLLTSTKTAPGQQWDVARELRRRILLRFREEGLEAPALPWPVRSR